MRKGSTLFLITACLFACTSSDKKATTSDNKDSLAPVTEQSLKDSANFTTIEWLDSTYLDLGKLKEGNAVELSFRFKNTGTKNLIIQNVSAQCGCTIPEKPEKPYAPGETGTIVAKFNGAGHGEIRKEVYVTANTSPTNAHTLVFRAEMIN